jgi:hypothetical protein
MLIREGVKSQKDGGRQEKADITKIRQKMMEVQKVKLTDWLPKTWRKMCEGEIINE